MDECGSPAAAEVGTTDDANALVREPLDDRVEPIHVDREVMEAPAALVEEARDGAVAVRRLEELHLVAGEPEAREVERSVAAMCRAPELDREEALEPVQGRVDRPHRAREMIDAETDAITLGDRVGRHLRGPLSANARDLPELHQDP